MDDYTAHLSHHHSSNVPWVLGSASPRRQKLLGMLGHAFEVQPSSIDELCKPHELPRAFALRMAEEKAMNVAESRPHHRVVIGGDTVVAMGMKILGKPSSTEDAQRTLQMLSAHTHEVWSGWAIAGANDRGEIILKRSGVVRSVVRMREISLGEIDAYISTGEPLDKAGSYGIQGRGGRFVDGLEGSFYSVIGLPVSEVLEALITEGEISHQGEELSFIRRGVELRERCALAAWRSGRGVDDVHLLAVSKRHSIDKISLALRCGLEHFGENYAQELSEKSDLALKVGLGEQVLEPKWHYIGGIQRNKAKRIGGQAQWVHSLSRLSEAQRLSSGAESTGTQISALIQVNLADEESKGGVRVEEVRPLLDSTAMLPHIQVTGLMTFPPLGPPEEVRPYFKRLRRLRDQLVGEGYDLPHLSMGTSDDFEVAIEEGATWVRLGRCLFGERPPSPTLSL